jgi:hypothetical protein
LYPVRTTEGELLYDSIGGMYLKLDGELVEEWDLGAEFRVLDVAELDMVWAELCYEHRQEKDLSVYDC